MYRDAPRWLAERLQSCQLGALYDGGDGVGTLRLNVSSCAFFYRGEEGGFSFDVCLRWPLRLCFSCRVSESVSGPGDAIDG